MNFEDMLGFLSLSAIHSLLGHLRERVLRPLKTNVHFVHAAYILYSLFVHGFEPQLHVVQEEFKFYKNNLSEFNKFISTFGSSWTYA